MPVQQVRDMVGIEADHVYVIPPGRRIVVTDKHLDVEEFEEPRGGRTPVDHFFRVSQSEQEATASSSSRIMPSCAGC